MNRFALTLVAATVGAGLGIAGYHLYSSGTHSAEADQTKPLYWVAPMDPNYRRDQPGKSPMGMDLIPVYEESGAGSDSPGTVKISPEVENNLGVRTTEAAVRALHTRINTVGYVGFNEDALVHVHPRVEGWLETLFTKVEGERVQKGDPLFAIYSPALVNAQEELLLALDRGNKKLVSSAKERLRALQVPEKQIQQVIKTRKVSRTVTVYAPKSGIVANLGVFEGFYVKPGKTILSVGPLDEVWVTAEVFERQATLVNVGDRVSMTLEYLPGKSWEGTVDYIYPTLDQKNRTARVRLRFENLDELLKPNMFAQVAIHSDAPQASLIIPREAVIRSGQQDRVVLALGDGKFKSVDVTLGRINPTEVEVVKGLEQGDRIVTSAQFLLDSESSISSDFSRMSIYQPSLPNSVWAEGTVKAHHAQSRKVTVDHKAVAAWEWPQMVMDFDVGEEVNFSELQPGTQMHFEITKADTTYSITGTHIMSAAGTADNTGENLDHSQHEGMDHNQHEGMDHNQHEGMDHSQHEGMDHSLHEGMDHSQHGGH